MTSFTAVETCGLLHNLVRRIGSGRLGITPEEVGTHLVRTSFVMSLILGGTLVFEVMLVGQWTSDAFIRYVREQILELSKGISRNMIQRDKFFAVPQHDTLQVWSRDTIQASHSLQLHNSGAIQPRMHIFG